MARLVSFLAVFLIPLTASSAAAAGSLSPALGGSGGDAFVTSCSDDEVLVGVRVRADAWLDFDRAALCQSHGCRRMAGYSADACGYRRHWGLPGYPRLSAQLCGQWIFGKGQCFRQSASPRMPPPDLADRPSEQ